MPNYDYKCSQCGVVNVIMRKIAERDEATPCPACGAPSVRVVTAPLVLHHNSTTGYTDYERIKYRL